MTRARFFLIVGVAVLLASSPAWAGMLPGPWTSPGARNVAIDADGNVFTVAMGTYTLEKRNQDGALLWDRPLGSSAIVHVAPNGDVIVGAYVGSGISRWTTDGQMLWRVPAPGGEHGRVRALDMTIGGDILVALHQAGVFARLDGNTGTVLATHDEPGHWQAHDVAAAGNDAYLVGPFGTRFIPENGEINEIDSRQAIGVASDGTDAYVLLGSYPWQADRLGRFASDGTEAWEIPSLASGIDFHDDTLTTAWSYTGAAWLTSPVMNGQLGQTYGFAIDSYGTDGMWQSHARHSLGLWTGSISSFGAKLDAGPGVAVTEAQWTTVYYPPLLD